MLSGRILCRRAHLFTDVSTLNTTQKQVLKACRWNATPLRLAKDNLRSRGNTAKGMARKIFDEAKKHERRRSEPYGVWTCSPMKRAGASSLMERNLAFSSPLRFGRFGWCCTWTEVIVFFLDFKIFEKRTGFFCLARYKLKAMQYRPSLPPVAEGLRGRPILHRLQLYNEQGKIYCSFFKKF